MNSILFLTKGDRDTASSRLRVWQVRDSIAPDAEVIHSIAYAFTDISRARVHMVRSLWRRMCARDIKILFVHKSLFPWDVAFMLWLAKILYGKQIIYDLDDAEWIHSPRKTHALMRMADIVFAGSHEIFDYARSMKAQQVVLVPTSIDVRMYQKPKSVAPPITVGWIGQGKAHFRQGNFTVLKPALDKLAERNAAFRLVIAGSENYQPLKDCFKDVRYEVVYIDEADWKDAQTPSTLIGKYHFDIGVMPLVDSDFNRAKCALKAIEYMASALPVVASRIGEAKYVVDDGKSGFLALTDTEWVSALERLVGDTELRARLGDHGRKIVLDRYSLEEAVSQIQKVVENPSQNH
ncbi:MAG: glycosyltransferase family 4 protein [Patescibacteria group bacterium]